MSDLLMVMHTPPVAKDVHSDQLLMVEDIPVDPLTAPYLITSTRSVMWIEKPHPRNVIRGAVRTAVLPQDLFREMVEAVAARSIQDQWGSVQPYSYEGYLNIVEYLKYYDITDLDVLSGPGECPRWMDGIENIRVEPWVPDNTVVVLPKDRAYVGTLWFISNKSIVAVIHNASRGIGILRGQDELAE